MALFFRRILLIFVTSLLFQNSFSQSGDLSAEKDFISIYNEAQERFGIDPLLQNGIYYEYAYYNAQGHPFLFDGEFHEGSIIYRNKSYDIVRMKYDIFNQQIVINQDPENQLMVSLLANDYVREFALNGKIFKRLVLNDEQLFYQVVSEVDGLACYYYWQKSRSESREVGEFMTYVFSENKRKSYLQLGGSVEKYRNNKSFIGLFPDYARSLIKSYLRENKISVKEADDYVMKEVILFSKGAMKENLN